MQAWGESISRGNITACPTQAGQGGHADPSGDSGWAEQRPGSLSPPVPRDTGMPYSLGEGVQGGVHGLALCSPQEGTWGAGGTEGGTP